jgi:adenylate kinase
VSEKVLDSIEEEVARGGNLIDFHTCEIFPESWIDLVVVLQTDHTVLWNRLEARLCGFVLS